MFTTDYDGTVIEQPARDTREKTPCLQCGVMTVNIDSLICDNGCKAPRKGIRNLGLTGGAWVRDAGGVMRWVE